MTSIQGSIQDAGRTNVLSKGIVLKITLSFKNTRFINFCGYIDPQKSFNNKKFLDYGTYK